MKARLHAWNVCMESSRHSNSNWIGELHLVHYGRAKEDSGVVFTSTLSNLPQSGISGLSQDRSPLGIICMTFLTLLLSQQLFHQRNL